MNKHTPGPWRVSPYYGITGKSVTVAKTEQMPGNYESERMANARLIAAAPDLLDALEKINIGLSPQSILVQSENLKELINSCFEIAREAIRKAKGEI